MAAGDNGSDTPLTCGRVLKPRCSVNQDRDLKYITMPVSVFKKYMPTIHQDTLTRMKNRK